MPVDEEARVSAQEVLPAGAVKREDGTHIFALESPSPVSSVGCLICATATLASLIAIISTGKVAESVAWLLIPLLFVVVTFALLSMTRNITFVFSGALRDGAAETEGTHTLAVEESSYFLNRQCPTKQPCSFGALSVGALRGGKELFGVSVAIDSNKTAILFQGTRADAEIQLQQWRAFMSLQQRRPS